LKTLLWLMAVVGLWCLACRLVLLTVRDFHSMLRTLSVCSLVVATAGIACMANAARMKIGQNWQRGAVQFGWVVLGVAMLVCAAFLGSAVSWFALAAGAG
jgi:hypothetical protein